MWNDRFVASFWVMVPVLIFFILAFTEVFQKLAFETERQIDDQCSRYRDELEVRTFNIDFTHLVSLQTSIYAGNQRDGFR